MGWIRPSYTPSIPPSQGSDIQPRKVSMGRSLAIFILVFVASVSAACGLTMYTIGPNLAGISHMLLSLICASPVAIGFFLYANARIKKGIWRTLLPLLVFPLVFGLLVGYTMIYERNPQHMFRVFVADPIPTGVTNIQAKDISGGFDEDIIISFQAPTEVINSIIAQLYLEKAADPLDGKHNFPDGWFPEYSWGPDWNYYQRIETTESGALNYFIMIWVDPTQSIAIYRKGG